MSKKSQNNKKQQTKKVVIEKIPKAPQTKKSPVTKTVVITSPGGKQAPNTGAKRRQRRKRNNGGGRPWWQDLAVGAGSLLGAAGKAFVGFGDYDIQTNSIIAQATGGQKGALPMEVVNSPVVNVFRHADYIGDVLSSTDFSCQTFAVNPAIQTSFPYMCVIAAAFENYRFRGLVYEFRSESGSYAANQALGYVLMASQYNALSPPFKDKQSMANHYASTPGKPSKDLAHGIECAKGDLPVSMLYTRTGDVPANADKRLYDLCQFSIASGGQATSGAVIGELWAVYEIEFMNPKTVAGRGNDQNAYYAYNNALSSANPLGTGPEVVIMNNNVIKEHNPTQLIFVDNLLTGDFLIEITWTGSTGGVSFPGFAVSGKIQTFPFFQYLQNQISATMQVGAGTLRGTYSFAVRLTGQGNKMIYFDSAGIYPGGTTCVSIFIQQIPSQDLTLANGPVVMHKNLKPKKIEIESKEIIPPSLAKINSDIWKLENAKNTTNLPRTVKEKIEIELNDLKYQALYDHGINMFDDSEDDSSISSSDSSEEAVIMKAPIPQLKPLAEPERLSLIDDPNFRLYCNIGNYPIEQAVNDEAIIRNYRESVHIFTTIKNHFSKGGQAALF